MKSAVTWAVIGLALVFSLPAAAASFTHRPIGYFVPEKRIRIDAGIVELKGVKLARVYFKANAQAEYLFVPMAASAGRGWGLSSFSTQSQLSSTGALSFVPPYPNCPINAQFTSSPRSVNGSLQCTSTPANCTVSDRATMTGS